MCSSAGEAPPNASRRRLLGVLNSYPGGMGAPHTPPAGAAVAAQAAVAGGVSMRAPYLPMRCGCGTGVQAALSAPAGRAREHASSGSSTATLGVPGRLHRSPALLLAGASLALSPPANHDATAAQWVVVALKVGGAAGMALLLLPLQLLAVLVPQLLAGLLGMLSALGGEQGVVLRDSGDHHDAGDCACAATSGERCGWRLGVQLAASELLCAPTLRGKLRSGDAMRLRLQW